MLLGNIYLLTRGPLDIVNFNFGNRVCEQWNHLPGDVVSSSSVNIFKGSLGRLNNYLRIIGGVNRFLILTPAKPLVGFAHANLLMSSLPSKPSNL